MPNLTQAQHALLVAAAADSDRGAAISPEATRVVGSLTKRGFATYRAKGKGPKRLFITKAGRAALATDPEASPDQTKGATIPKGKLGAVLQLLRRPEGATIEAMMAATGWQAHSVRGAVSGAIKKKLGLEIASEKKDGVRVYWVASQAVGRAVK